MVKNNQDKIFELKIQDDDDMSGIDSISLVDEPAIEVNWIAFKKETEHSFEQDDVFVKHLMDKGETEEDMIMDGWSIESVEILDGKSNFAETNPNAPSFEDTKEYRVRYKYILNPNITGQPAIIPTSRHFCRELIAQNKVWRVEDIESAVNDFGESPLVYRGSFNCRHVWSRIRYQKDGDIINKASVNKNKVDVNGFPSGTEPDVHVLGYNEPSTITNKTKNNPSPSTIKNLGLAKTHKVDPIMINGTQVFEHGQDEHNKNGLESSVLDSDLTEYGKEFAKALGEYAAEHGKTKIISSDIKRAKDTAKFAAEAAKKNKKDIKTETNSLLNTMNIGKYSGMKSGEFNEKYWSENPDKIIPQGETFQNFANRMVKCYKYVSEAPKEHQIISHSKVIRALDSLRKTGGNWTPETTQHFLEAKQKFDFPVGGDEGQTPGSKDKPKVSMDYDGVLSTPKGQELAKELMAEGNDLYIITKENELEGGPILDLAKKLRIPADKVFFTDGQSKIPIIKALGIKKHYDNSPDIVSEIKKNLPGVDAEQFDYDVAGLPAYVDQVPRKKNKVIPKSVEASSDFLEQFDYLGFASHNDYPQEVKDVAKRVLKWVDQNGWGSCGTAVGKQRANQLANGEPLSESTIHRMYSYLSRHKGDLKSSKTYDDGCGKLMYDSWGGEPGLKWAERKIQILNAHRMEKQKFATDEEKHIVLGPCMIPNERIFRKDEQGNPYYVFFSPDTIQMIADKYMRNKFIDNNDENHDGEALKDVYVLESWIKQSNNDKSTDYGYENLPVGTWFVSMKVNNPDVWNKIKAGQLNGFSVSGYFEEVAAFNREEMFLKQVVEILKKYE